MSIPPRPAPSSASDAWGLSTEEAPARLALLRQQLRIQARIRRDGAWITVAAEELVPGDVLPLRQGGIVPADVRIEGGSLLLKLR